MENKSLKTTLALLSIIGGAYLLLTSIFSLDGGLSTLLKLIVKIALILIGLVVLIRFKSDNQVTKLGALAVIVGGVLGILHFIFFGGILAIVGGGLLIASFSNSNLKDLNKDDIKSTIDSTKESFKNFDVKDVKEAVNTSKETLSNIKKEDLDSVVKDAKDSVKDIDVKEMANKAKSELVKDKDLIKEKIDETTKKSE